MIMRKAMPYYFKLLGTNKTIVKDIYLYDIYTFIFLFLKYIENTYI